MPDINTSDSPTLDAINLEILRQLQQDARLTNSELARRVQLSSPGLQKRLQKLEESGLIDRYVALINREKLGFDLLCFIQVNLKRHDVQEVENFRQAVQEMPEVMECYHLTGETDYLLKVALRNRKHLEQFLLKTLTPVPGVDKIRTSLVLNDVKVSTELPIDPPYPPNGNPPPQENRQ